MKTLVLFHVVPEQFFFFIVDEDWSKFDNQYINGYGEHINELCEKLYDENGNFLKERDKFTKLTKKHEWDIMITCGCVV